MRQVCHPDDRTVCGPKDRQGLGVRYNWRLGGSYEKMSSGGQKGKASAETWRRRRSRFYRTRARELRGIAKALASTKHPFLVHIIPMRRCNLDCGYCNEYDDVSKPVPLEEMKRRLDLLADMGTSIITISGGEPLMHPELDEVIRYIRKRGMIAGLITNGFFLNRERIERLNDAGLEHLQISIDNAAPDEVSKKSLKSLDGRLEMLSEWAEFQVNINSVLGSGVKNSEDALMIAHRALELGFTSTVGIIHDHDGQLKPLAPRDQEIFEEIMLLGKRSFSRFNQFQHNVAMGTRARLEVPGRFALPVHLRRRAGALVLATARISRDSAGGIYGGDAAAGVFDAQELRADVHGELRATGGNPGQLARGADDEAADCRAEERGIGADCEVRGNEAMEVMK